MRKQLLGEIRMSPNRGLVFLAFASLSALAPTVFGSAVLTFTTSGNTGAPVSGQAVVTISASTISVELTNSSPSVDRLSTILDGLSFAANGASGVALTSVNASGFVDCTGGGCVSVPQFTQVGTGKGNPSVVLTSPYTWTYNNATGLLSAGNGTFKPAGVVNDSISATSGIFTNTHNDYLMGPVTFNFSYTGTISSITGVNFYWGGEPVVTAGVCTSGTCDPVSAVPEPSSVFLLGTAGIGILWRLRTRKQTDSSAIPSVSN